ncbi:MAG: TetR/AcrR family transcriptional regulator [Oscillospiraceae bacterium]|jgi:AcrR family transcriptional regulator|nr:TetR/AcrR family transcriptional regulator [Oscillospiraceae bacterium]
MVINMRGTTGSPDLRIVKTRGALAGALCDALARQKFSKITIFDICAAARVSRATFYTHFVDKYDLLKHLLAGFGDEFAKIIRLYGSDAAAEKICSFMCENTKFIVNLLKEPDREVIDLLTDFFADMFSPYANSMLGVSVEQAVASRFCAGGLINLMMWYAHSRAQQRESVARRVDCVLEIIDTVFGSVSRPELSPSAPWDRRVTSVRAR